MKIAVIGAGWAGLAVAVRLTQNGHHVTVLEASRHLGGRARGLPLILPDGATALLDNGQHILIGAYTETLALMREIGISAQDGLLSEPMNLIFPDGSGLQFPKLLTPFDALWAILSASGWDWRDKLSLLSAAAHWQRQRYQCAAALSVSELCQKLRPRVMAELINPLCISALNTPATRASAQVFLRVLHDALLGAQGGSQLLLPRRDLSALFAQPAAAWLQQRGSQVLLASRVTQLSQADTQWQVNDASFDRVILATPAHDAAHLVTNLGGANATTAASCTRWAALANALSFEAITTVYAWAQGARLSRPMLALHSDAAAAPAQFVFDRGQLGGPRGLLAFVVSASQGDHDTLQAQVLLQAKQQLGLELVAVKTVVEKRATFACTPGLVRPSIRIASGLLACGDYVDGPYPATLEGAVRSGLQAAQALREEP